MARKKKKASMSVAEPEPEPKPAVPYTDALGAARGRDQVFGEPDLQRHIGEFLDIRSRLKLAASHPLYYDAGKEVVKEDRKYVKRTNYLKQKVFKNVLLQDYIGSYLSPAQRSRVRSATMTLTGTRPVRSPMGVHLWGPGARGTYFDEDYESVMPGVRYYGDHGTVESNPSTTPLPPGLQRLTRKILHTNYLQRARPHTDFRIQYPT
jgi:hypothetical protein